MKSFMQFLLALLIGLGVYYYFVLNPPEQNDLEKQFMVEIPEIFRSPGGDLEVVSFKTTEILSRSSSARLPFTDWEIPGTRVLTEVRVPVTYRYHVRLREDWDIRVQDGLCTIYAPKLRPTLPPAIHTSEMRVYSDEGLFAFDGDEEYRLMISRLTPTFEGYAESSRNYELVREQARRTVEEFVQSWLLQRGDWGDRKVTHIEVVFADEPDFEAPEQRSMELPKPIPEPEVQQQETSEDGVPPGPFKRKKQ